MKGKTSTSVHLLHLASLGINCGSSWDADLGYNKVHPN